MPLLGSIGPVTVGSAAVPWAAALVVTTAIRVTSATVSATATRAGTAQLDGLIGPPPDTRTTGALMRLQTSATEFSSSMGRSTRECRHELRIGAAHSPADRGVSAPAGASRTGE